LNKKSAGEAASTIMVFSKFLDWLAQSVARKPFYRRVHEVRGDFYRFLRVLCGLGGVKLDFEKTMCQ
jgi:hypothetical protein